MSFGKAHVARHREASLNTQFVFATAVAAFCLR
jgi:hypothetical protein